MNKPSTIGFIAREYGGVSIRNEVMRSAAGYYIGTQKDDMPFSRESVEYFKSQGEAEEALKTGEWTQKLTP